MPQRITSVCIALAMALCIGLAHRANAADSPAAAPTGPFFLDAATGESSTPGASGYAANDAQQSGDWGETLKNQLLGKLPPAVSDGLDVNAWIWLGYTHNDQYEYIHTWDEEFSLSVTKSFSQRAAVTFEGNVLDANGYGRVELEQGFVSFLPCEASRTIVTVGKFNANFGVEARDFWDRTTGTTSLLFGAEPQDLVGVMVTQPLGNSGITLRPFISADFQGQFAFDQAPSIGVNAEYRATKDLDLAITQWTGPGLVLFGGHPLHQPYNRKGYGDENSGATVIGNWQGPNLYAERGGTLYFIDGKVVWQARRDLRLSAKGLRGTTGTSHGVFGWSGAMGLVDYDLTDHWHFFGRLSYLSDEDWLITGHFQRMSEVSGGVGYRFNHWLEIRGEYRHDDGNRTGTVDSVSIHLTAGI